MIKYLSIKNYFFITALLLYSIISNPFPIKIGIPEILIGFLIILSINYTYLLPLSLREINLKFNYLINFQIILFVLLFVPTIVVIVSSKFSIEDYVRDIVPFLYIFMPYFYHILIYSKFRWYLYLPWIISIMGSILSFRYLYIIYVNYGIAPFLSLGNSSYGDNLLYLTYDASVHFSPVFLLSNSMLMLFKRKYFFSILTFILGMFPFLGNLIFAQRGPTFLTMACVSIFAIIISARRTKKYFMIILLIGVAFLLFIVFNSNIFSSFFEKEKFSIFSKLLEKQEKFGLNAKDSEFYTVLGIISASIPKIIFGIGWGSVFKNPIIYPGIEVSFTHSAFTYYLLKTGVLGLCFFIFYLLTIFKYFFRKKLFLLNIKTDEFMTHKILVFLSASTAIIIGILFQPSYKTLSFGVVLLILFLFY
jgi:O-Antigen ligase